MSDRKEIKSDGIAEATEEQLISSSRRNFTKTGLLASPVVMSIVSRPVFGVGCMSNVLSGNLSDPDRGDCYLGLSPGFWKEKPDEWLSRTGLIVGVTPGGETPISCIDCTGGSAADPLWYCTGGARFNSHFTAGPQDSLDRSMHEILCKETGSDAFHIIAALLNALADSSYVLTIDQVKQLWVDPTYGGQIADMKAFLNDTWT